MYVFLLLVTIFAFYHKKHFKPKLQKIFFYQKYDSILKTVLDKLTADIEIGDVEVESTKEILKTLKPRTKNGT